MRLNVISDVEERELDAIRARIDTYCRAARLDDLVDLLRARAAAHDTIETIDLIGHSRDGVLALGETLLDERPAVAVTMTDQLRPLMRELAVRELRLLGCSTASTDRGRAALRRIALATRCDVLGTRRYISRYDYAASGFLADAVLVSARAVAALIRARSGIRAPSS